MDRSEKFGLLHAVDCREREMRPDERVTEFIDDGSSSRSGGLPRSPSHQSTSSSSTTQGGGAPMMALMSQSMTLPHGTSLRRDNKPHPLMMSGKLNGMSVTMSSSSPKLNNRYVAHICVLLTAYDDVASSSSSSCGLCLSRSYRPLQALLTGPYPPLSPRCRNINIVYFAHSGSQLPALCLSILSPRRLCASTTSSSER